MNDVTPILANTYTENGREKSDVNFGFQKHFHQRNSTNRNIYSQRATHEGHSKFESQSRQQNSRKSCFNCGETNNSQLVNEPTRVTKNSVTLIDHLYSTNPGEITDVNVPAYCPGDPVSFTIKKPVFKTSVDKHVTIKYRNFNKFNQEKYIEDLKAKNFNEILYFDDLDHSLDAWYSKLLNVLNKHAPTITKRVKKKSQSKWLNQDINQLRAKRDFYHKKKDFKNYKLFRNKLSAHINKCKTDFFSKAVQSNSKLVKSGNI
ncbi:unnamed protein product [Mytilus coruscus]|uniref:Uncharacterized protein n=1 Tax=Mytilus coruscus TaxID=42192 RepID=A0A6J7ZZZ6_MYTCO|nr:unnamed protein product [Mytilus coruscus]